MSSPSRPFWHVRLRRRLALAMAVSILFAGTAQAAHYHKDLLTRGSTDVHCLLCLFAAGTAGPPAVAKPVVASASRYWYYRSPASIAVPHSHAAASYDARGPPAA